MVGPMHFFSFSQRQRAKAHGAHGLLKTFSEQRVRGRVHFSVYPNAIFKTCQNRTKVKGQSSQIWLILKALKTKLHLLFQEGIT